MANIKEYAKGSKVKITDNFSSYEFDCKCKRSTCKRTLIDVDHVKALQELRDFLKASISISSGYRCPEHNKEEGGEDQSRHMVSDATDINVAGFTPDQVADACESRFNGLGRYNTFTHVDSRSWKARWDFRKAR